MKMTDEEAELALRYVEQWLKEKHHWAKEVVCLDCQLRGKYIDVTLLEPYGLFIIRPDGSVEDNYEIFGKR